MHIIPTESFVACAQIKITGGGSGSPAKVSIPGYLSPSGKSYLIQPPSHRPLTLLACRPLAQRQYLRPCPFIFHRPWALCLAWIDQERLDASTRVYTNYIDIMHNTLVIRLHLYSEETV